MSAAQDALIEFGSVFRFDEIDRACNTILQAAQRDINRLARHGITQADLEAVLQQRDKSADAYAAFLSEGRKERVASEEEATEVWTAQGHTWGNLSYDPEEVLLPPIDQEKATEEEFEEEKENIAESATPETENPHFPESVLPRTEGELDEREVRESGRVQSPQDESLTIVETPERQEKLEFASEWDRLAYEKGILYGLLRRLCRLARHEFAHDEERLKEYSLPRPHEDLTSITIH